MVNYGNQISSCSHLRPKRVLFTANYVRVINRFLLPYLKWFQDHGWETWVAANNDFMDGVEIPKYCDHYVRIYFSRSPFSKETVVAYRQLTDLIDEIDFDIVHTHTPIAGVLTRLSVARAHQSNTSVIYTAHGFHFYRGAPLLNWILWYPVERFMSRFTDLLITINNEDYLRAKKFAHCNVSYVPGVGIDLDRFSSQRNRIDIRGQLGLEPGCFSILSVGDLIPRKNQASIIESLTLLPEKCELYICGEGPEKSRLLNIARQMKVDSRVHFLGYRNDIPEIMCASDCLVFPSIHEGLPVSVIEAMAAGLPVIASSIRGIYPDLIRNGENGLLLSANTPEEMARCVRLYMNNQGIAEKIALSAREDVSEFNIDNLLRYMSEIYESFGVTN